MNLSSRLLRLAICITLGCEFAGVSVSTIVQESPAGDLDPGFGMAGTVTTVLSGNANAMVLQPDGKLVVAGRSSSSQFVLARYLADGNLDPTFGFLGLVTSPGVAASTLCVAAMRWCFSRTVSS